MKQEKETNFSICVTHIRSTFAFWDNMFAFQTCQRNESRKSSSFTFQASFCAALSFNNIHLQKCAQFGRTGKRTTSTQNEKILLIWHKTHIMLSIDTNIYTLCRKRAEANDAFSRRKRQKKQNKKKKKIRMRHFLSGRRMFKNLCFPYHYLRLHERQNVENTISALTITSNVQCVVNVGIELIESAVPFFFSGMGRKGQQIHTTKRILANICMSQ